MLSYLAPPPPIISALYDAMEGRGDSESSPAAADTNVGTSSGPEISSTTARLAHPTLMRLGNNSTPQLGSSTSSALSLNQMRSDYPVFNPASFREPIGNTPITPTTKGSFTSWTLKKQGALFEDYHSLKAWSLENVLPSTSNAGSMFLDMESGMVSSVSSHTSHETEEARKSQDELARILDGLVL